MPGCYASCCQEGRQTDVRPGRSGWPGDAFNKGPECRPEGDQAVIMGDHAVTAMPRRAGLRNFFRLPGTQLRFRPHRGGAKARRVLPLLGATVMLTGFAVSPAAPAASASTSPVAVTVTSSPAPVAAGQAFAYTITAANTGTAAASGLTLTDTVANIAPAANQTAPFFTASTGSCSFNTS